MEQPAAIAEVVDAPQSLCKNIAGEVKCWGVLVVRQQLPLLLEEKSLITAQYCIQQEMKNIAKVRFNFVVSYENC